MRTALLVFAVLLTGACKDSGPQASAKGAVAAMTAFKDRMCGCKDEPCVKKVSEDMAAWGQQQPSTTAAMNADEQRQANEIGRQLGECMLAVMAQRAGAAVAPADAPTDAGVAVAPTDAAEVSPRAPGAKNAQGYPVECDDYKAAVDRIATCEALTASARETLVKGYQDASARWATMPEAMRDTLASACQGGTDAVIAVGKTNCGW